MGNSGGMTIVVGDPRSRLSFLLCLLFLQEWEHLANYETILVDDTSHLGSGLIKVAIFRGYG